jgi:hypothetical protein
MFMGFIAACCDNHNNKRNYTMWGKYKFLKPNVAVRTIITLPKGPKHQSK